MSKLPGNADLLQQLMDNMTDNIFFKDRDHRFIMINQANARWFGFSKPQEAIGKTDFDLFENAFAQYAKQDEDRLQMETDLQMAAKLQQTFLPQSYPSFISENEYIFATACYLIIDVATGELTGAMAGHTSPYLIRASTGHASPFSIDKEILGPALAVEDGYQYREFRIHLEPGDKVLMYTDGICEPANRNGIEFGEQQLQLTLQKHGSLPVKEVIERTLDEVKHFTENHSFGDDICLLGFTFNGLMQTGPERAS